MKKMIVFALVGALLYGLFGVDLTPAIPIVFGGLLTVGVMFWIVWTLHYVASGRYELDRRLEQVTRR